MLNGCDPIITSSFSATMHVFRFLIFLIPVSLLHAEGISRVAVTDEQITVHPSPAHPAGGVKVVAIEPYDTYQSSRNWRIANTNNGGVIDFNRESAALVTFTQPSGSFTPRIVNTDDLIETDKVSHLAIRVKVDGFTGTIPARAYVGGGGSNASATFEIVADGNWGIARLNLNTITGTTTWTGQRTLRLDFPFDVAFEGYENTEILIDWIAVTSRPDFENPLTWRRWDRFWDLGYQPAAAIADASAPITIDRFDGEVDRYYQKFQLVDGFTPIGNPHWVSDFSGLSYTTVTDHGFAPSGPGSGTGTIENGIYRMTYTQPPEGSPFDPQLINPNREIQGSFVRYVHAKVRMTGYEGEASSINAGLFSTAAGVTLVQQPFAPDGSWQILTFDMQSGANWGGYENIRLDIPNNHAISPADFLNATLEIDWIAATNDPDYDGTGRIDGYGINYDFEIDRLQTELVPFNGRKGVDDYSPADAAELGCKVGKFNFTINNLVDIGNNPRVRWNHDGLEFGLDPSPLDLRIERLATYADLGIATYFVILNQNGPQFSSRLQDNDWPFLNLRSNSTAPNLLYGFNVGDAYGLRYTRSVMEYIAHRMAQQGVTPCANWIYGNEVDAHYSWHNLGEISPAAFREYFSIEFRQAALVLAKYHPGFRVLLSHTHHWTSQVGTNDKRAMPSKVLIDELNETWKSEGNFAWDIAAHPYPQSLLQPRFWNDTQATLNFDTTKITYKNLELLPVYFQREELLFNGRQRDISLTEQGFNTLDIAAAEDVQAAAYAYHWHRFKRIPGIKADILHRLRDHDAEGIFRPGILYNDGTRKKIYDVLAAADTPDWRTAFDPYLPELPFSSWDDLSSLPAWTVLNIAFDEAGFTQGWESLNNTSALTTTAVGHLGGSVTGSDPQIGNNHFFALARNAERILIRMKTDSGSNAQLFWGTEANNNYNAARSFTWSTIPDGEFQIYDIDTLDHPDWKNQLIRRLRLDPTEVSTGSFEIAWILTGMRGDFDGDGISDEDEGIATMRDSDNDGLPDFADPTTSLPPDPYLSWLAAHPELTGPDLAPTADFDKDGMPNGIEFLMGTDPTDPTSRPSHEFGLDDEGNLVITFERSLAARAVSAFVDHGSDPGSFTQRIPIPADAASNTSVSVTENPGHADTISVIIPTGSMDRYFARIGSDIPFTP